MSMLPIGSCADEYIQTLLHPTTGVRELYRFLVYMANHAGDLDPTCLCGR
jgi:hypothetical protein